MSPNTSELVSYIDQILSHGLIPDASQNGVQVEGGLPGNAVNKICTAVDAGMIVLERAVSSKAQVLLVHHGLLWGKSLAISGLYAEKVRFCVNNGLTLIASHLPLDTHPTFGNSAVLAKHFGLEDVKPGFLHGKTSIGITGTVKDIDRDQLLATSLKLVGNVGSRMLPFGPKTVSKVGIVSGGTSTLFDYPEIESLDLLITGEARQSNFHDAMERKVNLLFVGHYASETVGVRALGEHLGKKFNITHEFLDVPTGI